MSWLTAAGPERHPPAHPQRAAAGIAQVQAARDQRHRLGRLHRKGYGRTSWVTRSVTRDRVAGGGAVGGGCLPGGEEGVAHVVAERAVVPGEDLPQPGVETVDVLKQHTVAGGLRDRGEPDDVANHHDHLGDADLPDCPGPRPGSGAPEPGTPEPGATANRRDRNCSSAPPRRPRSPGLILTATDRSIRCPLSRVPFVLWSVSQAWSSSRSSLSSRWVRETAGSSTSSRCRSSAPPHSRPTTSQSYTGVDRSSVRSGARTRVAGMALATPDAGSSEPVSPSIAGSGELEHEDLPADAQAPARRQRGRVGADPRPLLARRAG